MELKFRQSDNHTKYHDNVREVINQIIKEDNSATALLHVVYLSLYSFNYVGVNECYPSYDAIAERAGMSKSTVSRCISKLSENGVIIIKPSYNPQTKKTTKKYYFPLEFNLLTQKGLEEFDSIIGENEEWNNFYESNVKPLVVKHSKNVTKTIETKLKDYQNNEENPF